MRSYHEIRLRIFGQNRFNSVASKLLKKHLYFCRKFNSDLMPQAFNIAAAVKILDMELSPMQHSFIAATPQHRQIILHAPTGSGKTLAFTLAALSSINPLQKGTVCLVIVPSRELALQCEGVMRSVPSEVRTLSLVGGHLAADEARRLTELGPQVVFATPGRLLYHINRGTLHTESINLLIIDEFDKCLELGFREEMLAIRENLLRNKHEKDFCTWLFSATNSSIEFEPFIEEKTAKVIDFCTGSKNDERSTLITVPSPEKDKLDTLARLLSHINGEQAIVFLSYRESAERTGKFLKEQGFSVETYHGGLEQRDRERALHHFRSGARNVLVATDLAARGLDITSVRHIIHYHLPADEATFEHRNGRATRWEGLGTSYLIIGPTEIFPDFLPADDESLEVSSQPVRPVRPEWTSVYVGKGRKDKLSKGDIAGFFCKKGGLKQGDLGLIEIFDHHAFITIRRNKLRAALNGVQGEKIKGIKTIFKEV